MKRLAGILFVGSLAFVAWRMKDSFSPACLLQVINSFQGWELPIYLGLYGLAPVFMLPGVPISILGGVLFGPVWGTLIATLGATLGATLALLAARGVAREWVEARLTGRWHRVSREIDEQGWKGIAVARLLPIVPYNVLNYALGLTRISPWTHALVTSIFIVPVTATYAAIGYAGRSTLLEGGALDLRPALETLAFRTCLILLLVGFQQLVSRRRRAARQTQERP